MILIGDPHQLPAVGAGGLFTATIERHGAITLTHNHRQTDPDEQHALTALRAGIGRNYLAHAERTGRLYSDDSEHATKTRLLADWWQAARTDPAGSIMIALRRRDVRELNQLARTLIDSHGQLGSDRIHIGGVELAPSDRVVCRRNDARLAVTNGTRATITHVGSDGSVTARTDTGRELELPRAYLATGHVRHAYALTGHACQGLTVERAFVLAAGEARLQEWAYVALSRARHETRVYVTGRPHEHEGHAPSPELPPPVTRLAQTLEESGLERLAIDQQQLPIGPVHRRPVELPVRSRAEANAGAGRLEYGLARLRERLAARSFGLSVSR